MRVMEKKHLLYERTFVVQEDKPELNIYPVRIKKRRAL